MKRFGLAAVIAILAMSFTILSRENIVKKAKPTKLYTCQTTDYDKITDASTSAVFDNSDNGGSPGKPTTTDCFTLNHQPTEAFDCNDTQTHFCCATSPVACSGGTTYTLTFHYKS